MRCYGIGLQGATYIYLMGADPVVRIKPSNSARFGRSRLRTTAFAAIAAAAIPVTPNQVANPVLFVSRRP